MEVWHVVLYRHLSIDTKSDHFCGLLLQKNFRYISYVWFNLSVRPSHLFTTTKITSFSQDLGNLSVKSVEI